MPPPSPLPSSQQRETQQHNYIDQWETVRREFLVALRSTTEPFDSWLWTWRLTQSACIYFYGVSRLSMLCSLSFWRPAVPVMSLFLIELCVSSYFLSLRQCIVLERWCGTDRGWCVWDILHTSFVSYIGIMITLKFTQTCFTSPGVALPSDSMNDRENDRILKWRSSQGRGGIACCDPTFNPEVEMRLVSLYGNREEGLQNNVEDGSTNLCPGTHFTYCSKCQIWRPPRCHHCSACNRCVLQMDHHCPWVNNCIGYNNLRLFFTTLTFLLIACYYAILMTIVPFYELIREELKAGISKHLFGFSPYLELYKMFRVVGGYSKGNEEAIPPSALWIQVVFVIVVTAGCAISFLWSYHFRLICIALTTIDHQATLYQRRSQALQQLSGGIASTQQDNELFSCINPFSQKSWRRNVYQILGPNVWLNLVPSLQEQKVLPPYLPKNDF
mmetsp:Transcript_13351/g.19654  ORF Transcript_13351/g.19654 Transcript_13351/m.19654 type:complete len:443 (-) Transcript_13351:199-1527(-)